MTLDEAFKVAKAVGDCIDPPVIHGVFKSLNAAFPEFVFTSWDDDHEGDITVVELSTGKSLTGNIYE